MAQEPRPVKVVVADNHAIVREGLAALCSSAGLQVVGQCSDGATAVETILSLQPDFAVLDLNMPGATGIEAIRRLRGADCQTKLIMLTISRDDADVRKALDAGADAYLLKDGPSRHLVEAIRYISEGGTGWVSPLLGGPARFAGTATPPGDEPLAWLSPRELEVAQYLVEGRRAKDIAERLEISPQTVDFCRGSLMRKLNVADLEGLIEVWYGSFDPPPHQPAVALRVRRRRFTWAVAGRKPA